jgi:GT2 family glycosyltransferase
LPQPTFSSDCDVIIVNYNAGDLLADSISSALAAGATRVIVVDNHSVDDSIEHAQHTITDERLELVRNTSNLGFASACNIGARLSSAANVLFLNPDGVLEPGSLIRLLAVLSAEGDVGMVGGFLCNSDGTEQAGGRRRIPTPKRAFMRAFGLTPFATLFPSTFTDFSRHTEPLPSIPTDVEAISGACMLVKREALDDVGLWDEEYFLHCEDLDWCMRFQQKGWRVLYVPDAKVVHVKGVSSRARPIFVEWHKHKGMLRFYRKFFRDLYPGLLFYGVVLAVWLRFTLVSIYHLGRRALGKIGLVHG